jgi:nitric oxide reductase subunit B
VGGMFGMTLSFATAGIGAGLSRAHHGHGLSRCVQLKIQVHFLMLIATATLFSAGVILFIYDFFRYAPVFEPETQPMLRPG